MLVLECIPVACEQRSNQEITPDQPVRFIKMEFFSEGCSETNDQDEQKEEQHSFHGLEPETCPIVRPVVLSRDRFSYRMPLQSG